MAYQTDTPSFVNAVELLLGQSDRPDRLFRLSKPLSLFFPALLYTFISIPIPYGFLMQQLIAYWFSALFLYLILSEVMPKNNAPYLGMLVYTLCQPIAVYGLAMLTDGLGWCWLIIGIWISLRTILPKTISYSSLLGLGFFMALGFFIKESIVMAGIFTFFLLLIKPSYPLQQKLIAYSVLGFSFITTFIGGQLLVDFFWQESIFQWIQFGQSAPPPFDWRGFITQSYHTLDVYWFLFVIGFIKSIQFRSFSYPFIAFLLTTIFGWISLPLLWPYLYDRILFMIVPFMLVWVVLGALQFKRFAFFLILIGGIFNLLVSFGIYKYQLPKLIISAALLYLLFLLVAYYQKKLD